MPQSAIRDETLQSADFTVEAISVSKTFGGPAGPVHALREVTLGIARNEFFTLLGPSGCGKTTLLRIVAGFETPTHGEIHLDGEPIDDRPPYQRLVNTVFQNYALFPHKTVGDNIGFGLRMRGFNAGAVRQRVAEMLALVRLDDMAERMPDQLSGGQQQRVALARALANQPTVLLLDEPLSALDYKLRKDMRLELKRLQRETGITFIFVTHDQEEALEMSDRVAVMSNGEVQQIDEPVEVYERPVNRFVAGFIGETNFIQAEVAREAGDHLVCTVPGSGEFHASGNAGTGMHVTIAVRPEAAILAPLDNDNEMLAGEVVERVYQGSTTAYHIRLADGQIVIGRANDGVFAVGDHAALQVRSSGARVVPT